FIVYVLFSFSYILFCFIFYLFFFFFNDTATTEIYTLSLHDALPIYMLVADNGDNRAGFRAGNSLNHGDYLRVFAVSVQKFLCARSEEHTSELQSRSDLVCRLLLEKKKKKNKKKQNKKKIIKYYRIIK